MAKAAPAIAVEDLGGIAGLTPLRAASVSDAYLEQAASFVHGYVTGTAANPLLHIEIEDAARHKIGQAMVESDRDVLAEANDAARAIDGAAHAFSSANGEAVAAWGAGNFEKAVTLDPDFGVAWLAWVEQRALAGDSAGAIDVATRALERTALRTPTDRARIELLLANEKHDAAARLRALADLVRLQPTDISVQIASATAEMGARNFKAAVERYQAIAKLDPSTGGILNSLGYAQALAGDLEGARKTFEQYGAQPGNKPNALDSIGEAYFMAGKFADAEKFFLAAHQASPALLQGEDLLKAAYARFLAGDDKSADALAAQYFRYRANQHDPVVAWREASWLYATGRREQATAKLAAVANRPLAERQAALWRGEAKLPNDPQALQPRYEATSPTADAQIRVLYAAALVSAGRGDQARSLLQSWPMPWSAGDPLLESMVLPKTLELRKSLGMPAP